MFGSQRIPASSHLPMQLALAALCACALWSLFPRHHLIFWNFPACFAVKHGTAFTHCDAMPRSCRSSLAASRPPRLAPRCSLGPASSRLPTWSCQPARCSKRCRCPIPARWQSVVSRAAAYLCPVQIATQAMSIAHQQRLAKHWHAVPCQQPLGLL